MILIRVSFTLKTADMNKADSFSDPPSVSVTVVKLFVCSLISDLLGQFPHVPLSVSVNSELMAIFATLGFLQRMTFGLDRCSSGGSNIDNLQLWETFPVTAMSKGQNKLFYFIRHVKEQNLHSSHPKNNRW